MIISFADLEGDIWLNGSYVATSETKIYVLSYSLHYGTSIFEGMRAYKGEIFKSREHLNRFVTGCNALGLRLPVYETELDVVCHDLLRRNKPSDAYSCEYSLWW